MGVNPRAPHGTVTPSIHVAFGRLVAASLTPASFAAADALRHVTAPQAGRGQSREGKGEQRPLASCKGRHPLTARSRSLAVRPSRSKKVRLQGLSQRLLPHQDLPMGAPAPTGGIGCWRQTDIEDAIPVFGAGSRKPYAFSISSVTTATSSGRRS